MFLRLFENFVKIPSIRPFLTGNKALFPSLSPSGKVARSADRGLFKISPYVAASPCFFLLSQKSAKIVSRYAASPRGEAPPRGGGEGQLHFQAAVFGRFPQKKPGCISYLRIICNPADFLQFFAPRFRKGTKYTP